MKKFKNRVPIFIYFTLVFGLVMASLSTNYIIKDSQARALRLVEENYTRSAFKVLSTYPDFTDEQMRYHKEEISGLVIIDEQGQTIYDYGVIKEDPRIFDLDEQNNIYLNMEEDLVVVNIIPELLFRPEQVDFVDNTMSFEERKVHIHIEFQNDYLVKKIKRTDIQHGFIQFFLIAFFSLAIFYYQKGLNLSRRLNEQKSLVILGTALRTLTHEMKNPLSAIKLQGSLLEKKYPQIEARDTRIIIDEVDRLTRLMETVRDFLKTPAEESSRISLNLSLNELKATYPESITWDIPEKELFIEFNRDRFRSVMENLVNNALESGSDPRGISVHCMALKKTVNISVKDEGSGIPEEIQKRMFDPFYTTKTKGSGVGLMVVKKFLDEKNCFMKINSSEGKGTTVSFWLPLK
ncbi:HAMP domain-containing histidine kinase [Oceanispirochaeta crateris]|uniref:histidine kinase n=1 Tax=Oceanispirochaeta crateris TaxID=2518645 RepID=A0A5C1QKS0_9SPIO|nr:HAMP domain-containing sensor histidine kinase [Oceanispirochaeta crateris]QEN08755.1 HAMP domain-containing histidine kinase [Oceanispirochaeta crateris]